LAVWNTGANIRAEFNINILTNLTSGLVNLLMHSIPDLNWTSGLVNRLMHSIPDLNWTSGLVNLLMHSIPDLNLTGGLVNLVMHLDLTSNGPVD